MYLPEFEEKIVEDIKHTCSERLKHLPKSLKLKLRAEVLRDVIEDSAEELAMIQLILGASKREQ